MRSLTGSTVDAIIEVVVRLLAEERGQSEVDVRDELMDGGWELSIDSLRLVEILVQLEQELGVEIPADVDSARSMRSVRAFAEVVLAAGTTSDRSPSS
ncbi:phosphopantetheine-binding protein [Verrucosispora sp. WMMC514]|uniref:acyl carrier protein n=1 Tax=Verrucosispora sp. WMMC514 TaxID=3015156 RepID=UPI00248B4582|nr:phosphopantetheine-binding protein [Verrucosispora sp. WMMC514]WBB93347.1 phosphopantetheine-binding protein [Verrucosispora sp. WMMC514]